MIGTSTDAGVKRCAVSRKRCSSVNSGCHSTGRAKRSRNQFACRRTESIAGSFAISSNCAKRGSNNLSLIYRSKKKGTESALFIYPKKNSLLRCVSNCATIWQFFTNTCRLTRTITQVIQLGTTYITATLDFN